MSQAIHLRAQARAREADARAHDAHAAAYRAAADASAYDPAQTHAKRSHMQSMMAVASAYAGLATSARANAAALDRMAKELEDHGPSTDIQPSRN